MAGDPLQKLLPYVKKYGTEIWMASGFILYFYMRYQDNKTYKWVYGENDFQRRVHLDALREYLREQDNQKTSSGVSTHSVAH